MPGTFILVAVTGNNSQRHGPCLQSDSVSPAAAAAAQNKGILPPSTGMAKQSLPG